ncbi:MAG: glycosyltransferase [Candidatus Heimdallarchaeota archaeon]|nr:MAG: glycosyltransferase [Candidatus Heimdallarchaeota archaeon]
MNKSQSAEQLTVIIPTLNERINVEKMIDRLLSLYQQVSIIVADDGSTDGTNDVVLNWSVKNSRVFFLDRKEEAIKGLTISLVDALKITKTKFFIVIDCDFQHPPEKITDGLNLMIEGYQLVIGTRSSVEGWSFRRKIISWGATTLGKFSLLLRRRPRPKDIMSGFFGGEVQFVKELIDQHPKTISPKGYKLLFDLLKVLPRKSEIGEFFYTFQAREAGESKIGMKQILVYFRSLF